MCRVDEAAAKSILLVEDQPAVRELVRGALERQGHTVLQASEPAEGLALATINARAIDLVVTDILFERGNGLTLVGDLLERGLDFPVLYLSGLSEPPGELPGRRTLFLAKPFELSQLEWAVAQLLAH
jgi:two-component system response regulator MprA